MYNDFEKIYKLDNTAEFSFHKNLTGKVLYIDFDLVINMKLAMSLIYLNGNY